MSDGKHYYSHQDDGPFWESLDDEAESAFHDADGGAEEPADGDTVTVYRGTSRHITWDQIVDAGRFAEGINERLFDVGYEGIKELEFPEDFQQRLCQFLQQTVGDVDRIVIDDIREITAVYRGGQWREAS